MPGNVGRGDEGLIISHFIRAEVNIHLIGPGMLVRILFGTSVEMEFHEEELIGDFIIWNLHINGWMVVFFMSDFFLLSVVDLFVLNKKRISIIIISLTSFRHSF